MFNSTRFTSRTYPLSITSARTLLLCSAMTGAALPALAQNSAQPQYQGFQPELVQGIQEGFADAKPKIRHVYLAAPDVLAVVVDAQHLWSEPVKPYVPQPGDVIRRERPQGDNSRGLQFFWGRSVIRNGVHIGDLAGLKEDHLIPLYKLKGEALNVEQAQNPANYSLSAAGSAAQKPVAVFRKSNPQMWEWTSDGVQQGTASHTLYLKMPRALTVGQRYTLAFGNNSQFAAPVSFLFDDKRLRTEALEVNQVGYDPRQSEKVARLFQWLGSGGGVDFSGFKNFLIVDDKSGQTVFNGEIKLRYAGDPTYKMAPERTADKGETMPVPVYQLDFSAFSQPGVYRVVVPGLGTSFPFRIDENVWADATKVTAKGYLNQRSGIELGPPYTNYKRPRNFHPADGVPIYRTDPSIFFDEKLFPKNAGGNSFKRIQASIIADQTEPNAWGGWHDAGDYDRSILPQNHPRAVHAMLDLYESNPAYFESLNLNIPESKNAIPDIIDEALWCMEMFRRIQQADGGIPSAVESVEHPSEPSYLLKQPTAVTPPTPETCYVYAAAGAQLSLDLEKYDPVLAKSYRESVLRAMEWAANNPQVPNIYNNETIVTQHLSLASVWLYRLTGEEKWHEQFKNTLKKLYPTGQISLETTPYTGPWSIVAYALMPANQADAALQNQCRQAIIATADGKVARTAKWAYGLGPQRYEWDERLGLSWDLVSAHRLTNDPKYVATLERMAQFSMGLNPSNTSYTTGMGSRQVVPFMLDARYLGVPYPEGVSTLGPAPRNVWRGSVIEKGLDAAGLFPAWENWPWAESNFNVRESPLNEHIVGHNMANILMTRAYVAQTLARTP